MLMETVQAITSGKTGLIRQRGGRKTSPLRVLQLIISLLLLTGASIMLIRHSWLAGIILLILGTVVPFLEIPE
jgi:hypothetical protein